MRDAIRWFKCKLKPPKNNKIKDNKPLFGQFPEKKKHDSENKTQ